MRTSLPKNSALAVAAVAALALSLTACNGDDDASSSASAGATAATSSVSGGSDQSASPTAGSGSGGSSDSSGSSSGSGSKEGSGDGAGADEGTGHGGITSDAECELASMRLSFSEAGSSYTEMLQATNTGSAECTLTAAPTITYPDAPAALPTEGKGPQYPIRLAPGASAYSAIGLDTDNNAASHREKQLFIAQIGQDGHVTVDTPGVGLLLGDKSSVTYWWDTSAKAMTDGEG
ncbi:DUF4232 domain-containing protein [Streptomyces sp. RY43-2]|uniref:DUF4232 domain-containing protein n=1 Tax=Streptomyces macrolidinus TaxID=2952607 RepID=A0ABT0Z946_9ACTN|nr:DUF4232 domain-containing protein [Streptomyces macrolidinus]MCN9240293.1 DUF4232 domain-containing protein [Streptomyces macrolidinus]